MSTVALFLAVVAVIAIVAIVFACYQSHLRARELQAVAQEQARSTQIGGALFPDALETAETPGGRTPVGRLPHKFPTPAPIISNLPTLTFDSSTLGPKDKDEEPPTCVICFCEYEDNDKIKLLPCLHQYHEECIDAWLQRDHICPVCQADVILAAGLSLHDWSVHTQAAVEMLSGSRPHSLILSSATDTTADDGNVSVHQPDTPGASATYAHIATSGAAADLVGQVPSPTAAAAATAGGLDRPAMVSNPPSLQQQEVMQQQLRTQPAVHRTGNCQCQMRGTQQQSSTPQHGSAVAQQSTTATASPAVAGTAASSNDTDGTRVIIRPSWLTRGRTATNTAAHTAAAAGANTPESPNAAGSSSREVLSAPTSPVTPSAAAAAAGSSATADAAHVVLTIRQRVDALEAAISR